MTKCPILALNSKLRLPFGALLTRVGEPELPEQLCLAGAGAGSGAILFDFPGAGAHFCFQKEPELESEQLSIETAPGSGLTWRKSELG